MAKVRIVVFLGLCAFLCMKMKSVNGQGSFNGNCEQNAGPEPESTWLSQRISGLAHYDFCASLSGNSPGSAHFCKNCSDLFSRGGLGFYWQLPWFALYPNSAPAYKPLNDLSSNKIGGIEEKFGAGINQDLFDVQVTGVEINGKRLEGWFHIKVTAPKPDQYKPYAIVMQVEESVTFRAAGEFTTELADHCNGVDLKQTPTNVQILPCHAATQHDPEVSNMVVWWVGAAHPEVIRSGSDSVTEFHFDWKIPSDYGCSFKNDFFVRVDMATTNKSRPNHQIEFDSCDGLDVCRLSQPNAHTSKRTHIHLPKLENKYNAPDALPILARGQKVTCDVFIPQIVKGVIPAPTLLYWESTDIKKAECPKRECEPYNIIACNLDEWKTDVCRAPGADFNVGSCTLQVGVNRNLSEWLFVCNDQGFFQFMNGQQKWFEDQHLEFPKRELFLGRCIEHRQVWKSFTESRVPAWWDPSATHLANARFEQIVPDKPLSCRPTLVIRDKNTTDPDTEVVDDFETVEQYLINLRYDECNCYPPPPGDDGNLDDDFEPLVPPSDDDDDYDSFIYDVPQFDLKGKLLSQEQDSKIHSRRVLDEVGDLMQTYTYEDLQEKIKEKVLLAHSLHGGFVAFIFLFLIPVAIFIARYWKETFNGKTFLVYDIWYSFHLIFIALSAICLFISMVVLIEYHIFNQMLVHDGKVGRGSSLHKILGWIVIGCFSFLICIGGIRSYNKYKESYRDSCLNCTIVFHAITGFLFYVFGLVVMAIYSCMAGNNLASVVIVVRLGIDLFFHVVMTCLVRKMDKQEEKLETKRKLFPMELIIEDRDAKGKDSRLVLSFLYILLSLAIFAGFIYFMVKENVYTKATIKIIESEILEESRKNRL